MKNILTKFILLLVFVFGAASIGNASFVKTFSGVDALIVQGKTGSGLLLPIPSKYLIDDELCAPLILSIYQKEQLIYQTTTVSKSIKVPSFTKNGTAILILEILDYSYKQKITLDSF